MHRLVAAILGTVFFIGTEPSAAQTRPAERPTAAPPAYRQLVPGLLARTRFVAPTSADRRVELWDLLVGPGKRSAPATLPGGAVLEVRGGSGRITVGDKDQELRTGATLAVPDGTSFRLVNGREDLGLSIRATVIVGGRR